MSHPSFDASWVPLERSKLKQKPTMPHHHLGSLAFPELFLSVDPGQLKDFHAWLCQAEQREIPKVGRRRAVEFWSCGILELQPG